MQNANRNQIENDYTINKIEISIIKLKKKHNRISFLPEIDKPNSMN